MQYCFGIYKNERERQEDSTILSTTIMPTRMSNTTRIIESTNQNVGDSRRVLSARRALELLVKVSKNDALKAVIDNKGKELTKTAETRVTMEALRIA